MTRGSLRVLAVLLAAPVAAEESICANCWDGPEMFDHRHGKLDPLVDSISSEDLCSFPQLSKKIGGRKWMISHCPDGVVKIFASEVFSLVKEGDGYRLVDDPPNDERASATWLELRALTTKQLEKLLAR